MSKRSAIRALALATTAALSVAGAASAQSIELKLAHFLPTANGMHSDFMEPWARALEECSQGEVKVEIFPAGTQLGNPARLYDAVRAGAVDIAHGLSGIPGGRFERTRIAELPFMFDDADEATRALWSVFPDHLEGEFPGVKILALHAHNPGQVHTTSQVVRNSADMNGLRLRFPTEAAAAMLTALGANPVGCRRGPSMKTLKKA